MTGTHRGFRFVLESPLLQAGWNLEAAKREVATARRALQEARQQLDALRQQRGSLLAQCAAAPGGLVDLRLRDLLLRSLADIEDRLLDAGRVVDERRTDWTAAVSRCARRQQRVEGLNDVRDRQRAAFELEQGRADARRTDDDWLMRRQGVASPEGAI